MIDFGEQIRRIAEKKGVETNQILRSTGLEALTGIIEKMPRKSGFAVGSVVASLNSPSSELPDREDTSNGGQDTINAESPVIQDMEIGDTLYIVSNAPYMEKLEYGGYSQGPYSTDKTTSSGYSIQAPQGMFRLTAREILAGLRKS